MLNTLWEKYNNVILSLPGVIWTSSLVPHEANWTCMWQLYTELERKKMHALEGQHWEMEG